jgi:signal transduction histidine kinase
MPADGWTWQDVALVLAGAGLVLSLVYQVRLRAAIHRLNDSLRHPEDESRRVDLSRRLLTPGYVRELARRIRTELAERSDRIARQSVQEQVTAAMVDQFDDGLLLVDRELTIRFANRAAAETFARVRGVLGRPLIEAFLDHRIVEVIRRAFEGQARETETFRLEEFRVVNGERMERVLTVEAVPLPGGLGPLGGAACACVILRDESERYHVEQIRKDFVANASHEIRTPLSIILGYLENLSEGGGADPAVAARFYAVMTKHAQRLARIVDDMLTISKLEGPAGDLRMEAFDLAEAATDMVEHLYALIEEKKATVIVNFPEEDRSLWGDRFYWDQVFFNLVENALKQNDQPGLEVEVRMTSTEGQHVIEVRDNGVGIPGMHLPHVFKRFYRVERSHSGNRVKGTGLGLSIVKRAVEAHRGTVTVTSRPGQETVFRIVVPKGQMPGTSAED